MEMDDEEFTIIANYLKDLPNTFDIAGAPDEEKNKYTEVIQIINSFGQEAEASPEMAAPA